MFPQLKNECFASENPERECTAGEEILALASSNRHGAVYAAGNTSKIYVFDILKNGALHYADTLEVASP